MRILKYEINQIGVTEFSMHEDSDILSCQNQDNRIMIWALVDESKPLILRSFVTYITGGHNICKVELSHLIYLNTVLLDEGGYVAHVFEFNKTNKEN